MKLGPLPLHIIRDTTARRLHGPNDFWHQLSTELSAASRNGNALAQRLLEGTNGLLHSPLSAQFAPARLPGEPRDDDPRDRAAAERVVAAYCRAMQDRSEPPTASLWDQITQQRVDFLAALERRDVPSVQKALARMFTSEVVWGLGLVHSAHPDLLRSPEPTGLHFLFTDIAVSVAEALGVARVTSIEQDGAGNLRALDRDLDALVEATAGRLGFDPWFPDVGCAYGFQVAGQFVTLDGMTHALTAYRLRQLGARSQSTVFEIGGGYGCLALMAQRAGVGRYAIFDLPWVNALQGYFLIRALPEGTVQLYGENTGAVRVLPYWRLAEEPDGACLGLVNTNSLPEMGRATAAAYLPQIRRVVQSFFLSINQEAGAVVPGVGAQNCVNELVAEAGGFETVSRNRYWVRQGYVEEVFRPLR